MTDIARLKIQLDDMDLPVIRRVEVPLAIRLADLHLVIQIAMGWQNDHLYEFRLGRGPAWGIADPNHEDHDDMLEWRGPGFDPAAVDEAAIRKELAKFAKRRKGKAKATP